MGKVAVINMEKAPGDQRTRIIDFISGVLYGVNGSLLAVSQVIYIVSPEGIKLSDEAWGT